METKIKKPRALPRIWKRFFVLKRLERFTIGSKTYFKAGPFIAQALDGPAARFVAPWTRVRTTERVASLDTILKQGLPAVQVDEAEFNRSLDGQTHFVGDACQPPHPPFEQTGPSA